MDESVRHRFQDNRSDDGDRLADLFSDLGHPLTIFGIGGLIWGYGIWQQDRYLAETGELALKAVLASQAATAVGKVVVGRTRPDGDDDAYDFSPLSLDDDNQSWPSAHTAGAFALASVVRLRNPSSPAVWAGYGFATLVGLSRIYDDEHWLSDVVTGAVIGELAGRVTVKLHNQGFRWFSIAPTADRGVVASLQMEW